LLCRDVLYVSVPDVDHDELVRYANEMFGNLKSGEKPIAKQQKYFGGDFRAHTSMALTHASLVGEGVG